MSVISAGSAGTFVTVLGSSGCKYDPGNDTASFVINNKIIVDTGWNLVDNLMGLGLEPKDFKTVLFTHLHHDHYLALPQFLFYHLCAGTNLSDLLLIGPHDLNIVVDLAMSFLQTSKFYKDTSYPKCMDLKTDVRFFPDKEQLLFVESEKSLHPVSGKYYRVTDLSTGKKIGFSGDTAYSPVEISFFKNCDLLFHECSLGGKKRNGDENSYLHAAAEEAAYVAAEAGVKKLALVHYAERFKEDCFNAASNIFKGEILTPKKGDIIFV